MTPSRWRDAACGAAATSLALGASELLAGLIAGIPSLVGALGDWVIDVVPGPVKDWAIDLFGTGDKVALLVGIVVVALVIGGVVGVLSRGRFWIAGLVFGGFALIAVVAAIRDPAVSAGMAVIPAGLAVIVGLWSLAWLYSLTPSPEVAGGTDESRRRFLIGLGAVVGMAALAGGLGRYLLEQGKRVVSGRSEVVLPAPAQALPPLPAAAELGTEGLSPVITPNADFYRIDTAFLGLPRVDLADWKLTVKGMVDQPYSMDFEELLDLPMVERYVTLSCVSNKVGGGLVGNASWLGVPLGEVLDRAGVGAGAEQVVGRAVDGFTVGFPVEAVYDGREALLAVGMNGEPLPFEHGFPARLVVAGLYGYVSATKWLAEIELTRWDDFDAYWVPRGWSKEGPIKTQSRIDTPKNGARLSPGPVQVAGVAWAPGRGIERVEVRIDADSEWVEAGLSEPLSENSWRQWVLEWEAVDGSHPISVRATDGEGNTQTQENRPPAPDGASGWHTIRVSVA